MTTTPDASPTPRVWREAEFWVLGLLAVCLYGLRLGDLSIRGEESRRGRIAWEMLHRGDWLVPRVQGLPRLTRPPLQYWAIATVGWLRGEVDVWAVRLPSLLATVGTVLLIYWAGRAWLSPLGACTAGAMFASFAQVLQLGRLGETEALFTLLLAAALLVWLVADERHWTAWSKWLLVGFLTGLATLTKGPQAPVYVCGTIGLYLISLRRWRELFHPAVAVGLALMGGVVLSWQIPFTLALGQEKVDEIYLTEVAKRFERSDLATFGLHLIRFPLEVAGALLPWNLIGLAFLSPKVRQSVNFRSGPNHFLILSLLVSFPTVWLPPEARARYWMPLYPCVALLLGGICEQLLRNPATSPTWSRWQTSLGWLTGTVGVACLGLGMASLAGVVSISPVSAFLCGALLLVMAAPLLGLGSDFVTQRLNQQPQWKTLAVATSLGVLALGPIMDFQEARSVDAARQIAALKTQLPPGETLHSFGVVHHLFTYYLAEEVPNHPLPKQAAELTADVHYFCMDLSRLRKTKLPFEWEEVARINCDRTVRDNPECEVIIGRRLTHPPALQTARDFQEKTTR